MDTSELVAGGAAGLERVEKLFRDAGFSIDGIYLSKTVADSGYVDWAIRLITHENPRDLIHEYVRLKRAGALPSISDKVRLDPVRRDNVEASRIIEYANRVGVKPVEIEGAAWRGLYIDYALVADYPHVDVAVA